MPKSMELKSKRPVAKELKNFQTPQAIELEKAVLGAILVDATGMSALNTVFKKAEVFYQKEHQAIYAACQSLDRKNIPIDLLMVNQQLEKAKKLDEIGGVLYLMEISATVSSSANIFHPLSPQLQLS